MTPEEVLAQALAYVEGVLGSASPRDPIKEAKIVVSWLYDRGLEIRQTRVAAIRKTRARKKRVKPVTERPITAAEIRYWKAALQLDNHYIAQQARMGVTTVSNSQDGDHRLRRESLDAIEKVLVRLGATIKRP